jgi:acetyltransferase-like isoleucine patch superfamily enzyme
VILGTALLGASTPVSAVTVLDLAAGARLTVGPKATLAVGTSTYISDGTHVAASTSISIGRDCAVSWGVTIIDDDGHGFGPPPYSNPVRIEDRVWIGCNVTILKGVTIGHGSVVAAGAVVARSCQPNSLLAGVPARVVKEGVEWTDQRQGSEH